MYHYESPVVPAPDEPVCLVSYEVARLRLGGGPAERPRFWQVYREEQMLNRRTGFRNDRVRICRHQLWSLKQEKTPIVYFRNQRLEAPEAGEDVQRALRELG